MSTLQPDLTSEQQSRMADYCRTGIEPALTGITEGRLHHYRRLVYNVVEDTIATAYPLTKQLLTDDEWDDLVDGFFSNHKCTANQVWKMPFEWYEYIAETDTRLKVKYPFLINLLWFEWLEVELFMMEDATPANYTTGSDLLNDILVIHPEHTIVQLDYPVHKKPPQDITGDDKGSYFILMFRQQDTGSVQFFEISMFFTWLLERLRDSDLPASKHFKTAASFFGLPEEDIIHNSLLFITSLQEKGLICGVKK